MNLTHGRTGMNQQGPSTAMTPLDLAINSIERRTEIARDAVRYGEHLQFAEEMAPKDLSVRMQVYVDHTLSLLVRAGYLQRHHMAPGVLAYSPTDAWPKRD